MLLETQFIRTFVLNCTKLRTSSNSHPGMFFVLVFSLYMTKNDYLRRYLADLYDL